MKIGIVTQFWFEYERGGIETYVEEFSKNCHTHFDEIHFFIPNPSSDRVRVEKQDNVFIHKLPFLLFYTHNKKLTSRSRKLYEYLDSCISKYSLDIIETQNLVLTLSYFFAVNMISIKHKIPLVERVHGFTNNPLTMQAYKELDFQKILCVSKSVSEHLFHNGVSAHKLSSIYPGVDTQTFVPNKKLSIRKKLNFSNSDFVLLHASRIHTHKTHEKSILETKGIITVLKALSIVLETHPEVKLLIAAARPNEKDKKGFDKSLQEIKHYCSIYEIEDKVQIQMFNFKDMPKVYNSTDAFVLMSQEETFGLVYAEAMACEIPVIGSSVTGIPEVITNAEDGYLLEPDNSVELSKRITWLIQDEEKRTQFGKNGRERVIHKFAIQQIMIELVEEYTEIIKEYTKN